MEKDKKYIHLYCRCNTVVYAMWEKYNMGDLKKKEFENMWSVADDEELEIEKDAFSGDEALIARLRGYIERFYEQQEKKIDKDDAVQKKNNE